METILTDLPLVLIGTGLGYLAGMLPGIGSVVMLLISYPLIADTSLFQMLLFYLALISGSQFSGSIVATVFAVPGDPSSLPAVIEGNRLFNRGKGHLAISGAALGSVLGAFVAVAVIYLMMPYSIYAIKNYYNNNMQVAILLIACTSVIFLIGKNIWINILIFCIGLLLGSIGHTHVPRFILLPEIIPYHLYPKLYAGLPFFPVVVALYVFPILLNSYYNTKDLNQNIQYKDNLRVVLHLKEYLRHITSSIRGSLFGCVLGLVPHMGNILSSNLSYALEKRLGIRRKTYSDKGDIKSLIASETANNGASMVSLMPLVLLGIPITTSEAILLSIMERQFYLVNYQTTIETGMFNTLVLYFILINFICFMLSWPLAGYVNYIKKISLKNLFLFTGLILVCLAYYIGSREMNGLYYMTVLVGLMPLGFLLRRTETLILIIGFIMQDKIFASFSRFYTIWFM